VSKQKPSTPEKPAARRPEVERVEKQRDRLQRELDRVRRERDHLQRDRERMQREVDRLRKELDAARRESKRQAAPFSRGKPKPERVNEFETPTVDI